jgi:DNA excision repair protein ERCC-2
MNHHHLKTSVRNLVEFVLREGDLFVGGFQPRDRAVAGTRGHQKVQQARPQGYVAEIPIVHRVEQDGLHLEIFGRIDGVFSDDDPPTIEEIKTTTLPLDMIGPDHNRLHWAQGQCYAYMYARQLGLDEIQLQLTYYQLDTQAIKTFRRSFRLGELEHFFNELVAVYLAWAKMTTTWKIERDQAIRDFDFPYAAYRPGQREMAVAVYKTIRQKALLFIQAPTGVGKTIAALFPAIKAVGLGLVSKIFFLTAKTPGRLIAEKSLADMRQAGLRFKSVTLTAKDKACFCVAAGLDPEECPYAKNYYGKVNAALADIYPYEAINRELLADIARRHEVCPFELSLDLALWVDCIICDYNYAFDPRVYLRRFFDDSSDPYVFLVDEAHNLPDRAREMFSAELDRGMVLELKQSLPGHLLGMVNALDRLNQALRDKRKQSQAGDQPALVERRLPEELLKAVRKFSREAEAWLALNQKTAFRQAVLDFYFECQTYLRVAEAFDACYVSYFEPVGKSGLKARLYCLDPAPLLKEALGRSQSAIFFSATLLPMDYFQQLISGAGNRPHLMLPSPFPPENLSLLIHDRIATTYARRAGSYPDVAQAIAAACRARPGNYLVFFPSYAYLLAVVEQLQPHVPEQRLLIQAQGMTEVEREQFLARFSPDSPETLIGCAVMGGIFGEGIDLVGERLIGAIIVGVGLPQLCLERDLIKDYFNRRNNQGFAYAYQYPGLNRVMQAAGRVIRSETDRGVIILIDERFTQARYRSLFPPAWRNFQVAQNSAELEEKLAHFWQGHAAGNSQKIP